MKILIVLTLLGLACARGVPKYAFVEEWQLWKSPHERDYTTDREELEKHLVWLSNREYIQQHNANSEIFGFTLAYESLWRHGKLVNSHFTLFREMQPTYSGLVWLFLSPL